MMKTVVKIIFWYWLPPIVFAGIIFFLSTRPDLKSDFSPIVDLILRKIAHITEFFVLTLLLSRVGLRGVKTARTRFAVLAIAGLGAFITAIFDESIQSLVPGRIGSPRDVAIDSIGIILALIGIIWYYNAEFRSLKS